MKYFLTIAMVALILVSCGSQQNLTPSDNNHDDLTIADLSFGTDSTFEVMTWNLKEFPLNDGTTVQTVKEIIEALDVDVIALQEIDSSSDFNSLKNSLVGWNGYRANSASYDINLAFLYKEETVILNENIHEILNDFDEFWRPFPRPPLLMNISWNSIPLIIINNHFKSGGDGIIQSDEWDEEHRRWEACQLLHEYINDNYPQENVIVLGDMNDILTDPPNSNVFEIFIEDENDFLFADMGIAIGNSANWSWGNGNSHLDHILITNELFDEFDYSESEIETIQIDNYMEFGWQDYASKVSDHLPVALKLKFN